MVCKNVTQHVPEDRSYSRCADGPTQRPAALLGFAHREHILAHASPFANRSQRDSTGYARLFHPRTVKSWGSPYISGKESESICCELRRRSAVPNNERQPPPSSRSALADMESIATTAFADIFAQSRKGVFSGVRYLLRRNVESYAQ